MSYEDDIEIDETCLDVEWLNQPKLMLKYIKRQASAQRDVDYCKEDRDSVRAKLDKAIRLTPDAYGVVAGSRGITEAQVDAAIREHPDYLTANEAYVEANYELNFTMGTVRAFDHRKVALENLVRLHGQGYFAGPRVARDLSEERAAHDAAVNARVKVKRNT